ncbi:hypothetical protein [Rhizobium sp. BK251]|uniref:hypothetical protein n=1 Tax=Rhizobium sp. BK251 TaxID=2512125 RepID=UPI00104E69CC|nr:hypothetical protein [Rhizobium sp. BK251]TCL70545.1 hypothetical protein EV286_107420 [Rhizobium sp. BK251]
MSGRPVKPMNNAQKAATNLQTAECKVCSTKLTGRHYLLVDSSGAPSVPLCSLECLGSWSGAQQ